MTTGGIVNYPLKRTSLVYNDKKAVTSLPTTTASQQTNDPEYKAFCEAEPELAAKLQTYERFRQSYSPLQEERLHADCNEYLPGVLKSGKPIAVKEEADFDSATKVNDKVKEFFSHILDMKPLQFEEAPAPAGDDDDDVKPLRIGVVLSGGQAPGGHNVICGIFDRAKALHKDSKVFGFLDGPHGVFSGNFYLLTSQIIDGFRNTGGFDMIGSGRHKIESPEQFQKSLHTCQDVLKLNGLVVIGGDDSNTNAALLGEYFKAHNSECKVVGAPKTIDGDLKVHPYIPVSFGFDTACRTFAELVGNCCVDSLSAQKYYHFCRLMGRSASNIALECALQTLPNYCFIGEEVKRNQWGLKELTKQLADMVQERYHQHKKTYGVVLLPEGLIEFIPEFEVLIAELNELGDSLGEGVQPADVAAKLTHEHNKELFQFLPSFLQKQLLLDRDPHGNVQVAKIETEVLLAATVRAELEQRLGAEKVDHVFTPKFHAFGYEGRAGLPTMFDSAYCYALGATAAQLVISNKTGLIASVTGLDRPGGPSAWSCGGVPVTSLCVIERRKGKDKPVIQKALVDLPGDATFTTLGKSPYQAWKVLREICRDYDLYQIPGPMQFDRADIPVMLRIELEGSAGLLTALASQVLGQGVVKDLKADDEEKFFADLLALKSKIGEALGEQLYPIDWPAKGEHFGLLQGTRPKSALQAKRAKQGYSIPAKSFVTSEEYLTPQVLQAVMCLEDEPTQCTDLKDELYLRKQFPLTYGRRLVRIGKAPAGQVSKPLDDGTIGIVFCGRQTPGGHDVVAGLWDAVNGKEDDSKVRMVGFVGGSRGFFAEQMVELTASKVDEYRHTGGSELFGRSQEDFCKNSQDAEQITALLRKHSIHNLVLIGSVRTSTSACYLAEHFAQVNAKNHEAGHLNVVTIPLSQGGSFGNEFIEQSLGFDSTTKATARLVGNTEIDGSSARKYYYFLRTMEDNEGGLSKSCNASHVTLEVGLQTKPNSILIGEECSDKKQSLQDVVQDLADMVQRRWDTAQKNFGTVLVPDNLLAVVPETRALLTELEKNDHDATKLSPYSHALLKSLPDFCQTELLKKTKMDVQRIPTERMLAEMVATELKQRPSYSGKFSHVCQFLGYQTRCSVPSAFDSNYGYALGGGVAVLLKGNCNGYMASVANLQDMANQAVVFGVPLTAMLQVKAQGHDLPEAAIFGKLVDLKDPAYAEWKRVCANAAAKELYENPGPLQFAGECTHLLTKKLSQQTHPSYLSELSQFRDHATVLLQALRPGVSAKKLRIANSSLQTLRSVLEEL